MRTTLLEQIKQRRKQLRLKGIDMPARTGINRQQYGLIEKAGNPNLETLDKIAEGLEAELMLIPKEVLRDVQGILKAAATSQRSRLTHSMSDAAPDADHDEERDDVDDPWTILAMAEGKA
ncbi:MULTISPECIES: helix-turn-helix transcriptional regulator [Pseudomonas]|uniref:HTH cro/C1-type domain-containing protein n=1 Tax=Pseudomonas fulva TaxID=47880 RepID=A0A0D0KCM2_9PSED|nr:MULTISPECIES: helix-turn-helix transcriptional regulator [Pseudomonas]KIP97011.1 hypothetical protein RU08_19325 [Pseudomonas fulva]